MTVNKTTGNCGLADSRVENSERQTQVMQHQQPHLVPEGSERIQVGGTSSVRGTRAALTTKPQGVRCTLHKQKHSHTSTIRTPVSTTWTVLSRSPPPGASSCFAHPTVSAPGMRVYVAGVVTGQVCWCIQACRHLIVFHETR